MQFCDTNFVSTIWTWVEILNAALLHCCIYLKFKLLTGQLYILGESSELTWLTFENNFVPAGTHTLCGCVCAASVWTRILFSEREVIFLVNGKNQAWIQECLSKQYLIRLCKNHTLTSKNMYLKGKSKPAAVALSGEWLILLKHSSHIKLSLSSTPAQQNASWQIGENSLWNTNCHLISANFWTGVFNMPLHTFYV